MRILLVTVTLLLASQANAANKRCGLGSRIFGTKNTIISQLSETVTNALASGSSSISFGTSGCSNNGFLFFDPVGSNDRVREQRDYANANFEELLVEMAAGSGQTLHSFAHIFGCSGTAANAFGEMTRQSYKQIVDDAQISPDQMLLNVRNVFRGNLVLRQQCNAV